MSSRAPAPGKDETNLPPAVIPIDGRADMADRADSDEVAGAASEQDTATGNVSGGSLRLPHFLLRLSSVWNIVSALFSVAAIGAYLLLRFALHTRLELAELPLWVALLIAGVPLIYELSRQALRREFGADFLAGISIVTATLMGQPLVAAMIVLMLSGGQALETYATHRASSVLTALARRTPSIAHKVSGETTRDIHVNDIAVDTVRAGDRLVIFPHEICPVDGVVQSGSGTMDESFLTGEPFRIRKTAGSQVISGALNEENALFIIAEKRARDSRFARIMEVMRQAEANPPHIRRLADRLGAWFTPFATLVALAGWILSGKPERFLAVIVIATPCPLLLAIPIAIIGSISLAAKRGIVIKKPVILEQVGTIRTMLFDKTGTLTHGEPELAEIVPLGQIAPEEVLRLAASLEQYSRHPLATAIQQAARQRRLKLRPVLNVSERPGQGLSGNVEGSQTLVTGRGRLTPEMEAKLPESGIGMECVVLVQGRLAALFRFHDRARVESRAFVHHLHPRHKVQDLMILSGDRDQAVEQLARAVGIRDARGGLSPEDKLRIVQERTKQGPTLFVGDGINDAPAMLAATVGVAMGQNSDITAEAAGAVILEPMLGKVDELLHIGSRMRAIMLQSAIGGMILSGAGMIAAASGHLPPLAGAIAQEIIDVIAVLNALRAALPAERLQDF